jgi:hypothetical protein
VTTSSSSRLLSLVPFGYLLLTRVSRSKDLAYLVASSWIPAIWLAFRLGGTGFGGALAGFALGYLAFLCVYEIGYLVNDSWDAARSESGRHRLKFAVSGPYAITFVLTRLVCWAAIAWATGWWTDPLWLGTYTLLVIALCEHNLLTSPALRLASFVQLAVLRFLAPIAALVPREHIAAALLCAVIFYAYLRALSYLESKDLLTMPERRAPAFGFRQMLLLVPASVALALVLKQSVIAELMAYSLLIYGTWAALGRGNAQNKEKNR